MQSLQIEEKDVADNRSGFEDEDAGHCRVHREDRNLKSIH